MSRKIALGILLANRLKVGAIAKHALHQGEWTRATTTLSLYLFKCDMYSSNVSIRIRLFIGVELITLLFLFTTRLTSSSTSWFLYIREDFEISRVIGRWRTFEISVAGFKLVIIWKLVKWFVCVGWNVIPLGAEIRSSSKIGEIMDDSVVDSMVWIMTGLEYVIYWWLYVARSIFLQDQHSFHKIAGRVTGCN